MKSTDLILLDIKHIDDEQHKILTEQKLQQEYSGSCKISVRYQ